jgi:hypothetical protein
MELKVTSGGGMLAAIPTGFFSSKFRLEDNAALVGEIEASMWRERAQLELKDGTYSLYRTNVTSGDFVAERQGQVVARATKTSFWRDDFDVEIGKRQLKLRKSSIYPSTGACSIAPFCSGYASSCGGGRVRLLPSQTPSP